MHASLRLVAAKKIPPDFASKILEDRHQQTGLHLRQADEVNEPGSDGRFTLVSVANGGEAFQAVSLGKLRSRKPAERGAAL